MAKQPERFVERLVGGAGLAEERHARAEFEVIGTPENTAEIAIGNTQDGDGGLPQARTQDRMFKVSSGLLDASDCVEASHVAGAQARELRKDEPHPMGALAALSEFRQGDRVRAILCQDKALQIKWVLLHVMDASSLAGPSSGSARGRRL
jgi:hypothetical protein